MNKENNITINLTALVDYIRDKDFEIESWRFKHLEKFKENKKLQDQLNKQKEVLDKALYWLSENTHYTDFNVDKLVLDENVNLKELFELLEEIE